MNRVRRTGGFWVVGIVAAGVLSGVVGGQQGAGGSSARVIDGGGSSGVNVERGGGGVVVGHRTQVKLGTIREWTSVDGKTIHAELMAWPIEGAVAEEDVKDLKIEVVRQGKVRLRQGGKVSAVPLVRLSEADRAHVAELVVFHETWRGEEGEGEKIEDRR